MNIDSIANVQISLQTTGLQRAGFGTPLILGNSEVIEGVKQKTTITFSDILVTGNNINATVDGVAITQVAFTNDNNQTLDNLATEIASQVSVFAAVRKTDRSIEVISKGYRVTTIESLVVTGGSSQATATVTTDRIQQDEIRVYNNLEGVSSDFSTSSEEYLKAVAIFSQNPSPDKIKIGRRRDPVAQSIDVQVSSATDDTEYNVKLNGTDYTVVSTIGATKESIVLQLIAAITAGNEPVTLVNSTDHFEITSTVPGQSIIIETTTNLEASNLVENQGMADDILRANQTDSDWYFLLITTSLELDIKEASKTVETMEKLFFCQTNDLNVANNVAGNIGTFLNLKSYRRTILSFVSDTTENRDASYVAVGAPYDPGSITWVYKKEVGVTPPVLTATQENNLQNNNVNFTTRIKGVSFSVVGKVIGGDFIDTMRGIDDFSITLQENFLSAQLNSLKIPYTNDGIQTVAEITKTTAESKKEQGIFASYTVTAPNYTDTTADERGTRHIEVKFEAVLQGAIHTMKLVGSVTN